MILKGRMHDMSYYDGKAPAPDLTECYNRPNGQELMADLYLPDPEKANQAAVLFVHGGGWGGGARDAYHWHAHRLSLRGYVTCSISYRLSGVAPFPAAVEDCQAGMRWLRQNADRFKIQPDRIGAMGNSAGGHLVACLGVLENKEMGVSSKANCVVDVNGVHDFVSIWEEKGKLNPNWMTFLGGPISEVRENWIAASPAKDVTEDSAPMFLIHDPGDPVVPYQQALLMADALMKAGRPVQVLPAVGSGHAVVKYPQDFWAQKSWFHIVAWLDQYLLETRDFSILNNP